MRDVTAELTERVSNIIYEQVEARLKDCLQFLCPACKSKLTCPPKQEPESLRAILRPFEELVWECGKNSPAHPCDCLDKRNDTLSRIVAGIKERWPTEDEIRKAIKFDENRNSLMFEETTAQCAKRLLFARLDGWVK